jgi:hypothetical protein
MRGRERGEKPAGILTRRCLNAGGGGGHTSPALNQLPSPEPYRLFVQEKEREGHVRESRWACGKKLLPFYVCLSYLTTHMTCRFVILN